MLSDYWVWKGAVKDGVVIGHGSLGASSSLSRQDCFCFL